MQQIDIAIREERGEVTKASHCTASSGHISLQWERESFGTLIKAASPVLRTDNHGKRGCRMTCALRWISLSRIALRRRKQKCVWRA